ncbi:MAG: PEP-CTERM sorting domain-containing protein [Lentisphaeria bacterium]
MKAKTILSCAAAGLMTISSAWAGFLETNPVPGFNSTSGNYTTDAHGNQWTACQVAYTGVNTSAWGDYTTTSAWVPMTTQSTFNFGGGDFTGYSGNNPGFQSFPVVGGTSYYVERAYNDQVLYNAGLIFKPDVAGTYSWQGSVSWNNWTVNSNALDIVFGKFSAAGVWSPLLATQVIKIYEPGAGLDLNAQAVLHNIVLEAGDTLVVAGKIGGASNQGNFSLYSASINLVPEPASLALLALGGLALFRRRR